MSEKKRGGAGRGQGGKPKTGAEELVKRQVFFRPDQLEKVKGKNLSEHIRRLFDYFHLIQEPPEKGRTNDNVTGRKNHRYGKVSGSGRCIFCGFKKGTVPRRDCQRSHFGTNHKIQ